jgi:hypothetical protein
MFCSNGKPRKSWTRKYNLFKSHELNNKDLLLFFVDKIKKLLNTDTSLLQDNGFLLTKAFGICYEIIIIDVLGSDKKAQSFSERYGSSDALYCLRFFEKEHSNIRDLISHQINTNVFYNFMKNLLLFLDEIKYEKFDDNTWHNKWNNLFVELTDKNTIIFDKYEERETDLIATITLADISDIPTLFEEIKRKYKALFNSKIGGKYSKKRSKKSRRRRKSRRV